MKKTIKITAYTLAVIFLLLLLLPVVFKGRIMEIVKEQINNNLNAKVDFSAFRLSFIRNFPNAYIALEELSVSGINEFRNDTLLSFEKFSITADIPSIVKMKDIQIKSIILKKPVVHAIILPDGKANWDIVKEADSSLPETEHVIDTSAVETSTDITIKLQKFFITNADIRYTDKSSSMSASLENLNFSLQGDMSKKFTKLEINTEIEKINIVMAGIRYLKNTHFSFVANIAADMEKSLYSIQNNEIKINDISLGLQGKVMMKNENIITDILFSTKKTDFKSLLSLIPAIYMNDFQDIETAGNLSVSGFVKGTYSENSMPNAGIQLLVDKAMFKYPSLPKAAENIVIDVAVFYHGTIGDSTKIDFNAFHVDLGGNPVDMNMIIRTPETDMAVSGTINGKIDFATLADVVPLPDTKISGTMEANLAIMGNMSTLEQEKYEDFDAKGFITLNNFVYSSKDLPDNVTISKMHMLFSPRFVELAAFDAGIGKSDLQIKGRMEKFIPYIFSNDTITGNFLFSSSVLDLNAFLAEETPASTTATTDAGTTATADTSVLQVVEIPGNIDFSLHATIDTIYFDKLTIRNTAGMLTVKDKKISFQHIRMNLLEGSMLMHGEYNTQDILNPMVDFSLATQQFDMKASYESFSMVQQMAPIAKNCRGKYALDFSFTSYLDQQMQPIMNTITGRGHLASQNVVITNAKIFEKISTVLKDDRYKNIQISDINMQFKIENGRIYIDPFETKMGNTKMLISGDQGIDNTMNYAIGMSIPNTQLSSAASDTLNNLVPGINLDVVSTINIDLLVTGMLNDPQIQVKFKDATTIQQSVKEQVQQKAKEEINKVIDDSKARAKAEADRILREAEQRANTIKAEARNAAEMVRKEGYAAADKLVAEAKNPIAKKAAEVTAAKMKKEADEKANTIIKEGDQKAEAVMKKAREEASRLQ